MANETRVGTFQVNSGLITTGVVLAGVGTLFGLAGLAVSFSALASAAKRWATQQERPPSELARQQWSRAKAATTAGRQAWRDGMAQAASAALS